MDEHEMWARIFHAGWNRIESDPTLDTNRIIRIIACETNSHTSIDCFHSSCRSFNSFRIWRAISPTTGTVNVASRRIVDDYVASTVEDIICVKWKMFKREDEKHEERFIALWLDYGNDIMMWFGCFGVFNRLLVWRSGSGRHFYSSGSFLVTLFCY